MSARFVILHHVLPDGEHWDLMLEEGGGLLTWRLSVQPEGMVATPLAARRLGNHRIAYLEYQGPIAGDRGIVTRVDRGPLTIHECSPDRILFEAKGARLRGRFVLKHVVEDDWTLERL